MTVLCLSLKIKSRITPSPHSSPVPTPCIFLVCIALDQSRYNEQRGITLTQVKLIEFMWEKEQFGNVFTIVGRMHNHVPLLINYMYLGISPRSPPDENKVFYHIDWIKCHLSIKNEDQTVVWGR